MNFSFLSTIQKLLVVFENWSVFHPICLLKNFNKRLVVFDRQFSIINMRSSFFSPIDDRIFRSYKIIETLTKLSISCCQDHPFSYFHFIYLNYFYLIKLIKWNYIYNYFKHRIFFNFCSDLNILIFVCLNRTWA